MKLRNKKTGEIVDLSEGFIKDTYCGEMLQLKPVAISNKEGYLYGSLAELNEEWEDYKPAELYIENERVRKIVRAWAEINNIDKVQYNSYSSTGDSSFVSDSNKGIELLLDFNFKIDNLISGKHYTITELCREEKE